MVVNTAHLVLLAALLLLSIEAHADQAADSVPLKVTSHGLLGEHTYSLEISQSVDESSKVTHITAFSLIVDKRRFAVPLERLRALANPRIEAAKLWSYRTPSKPIVNASEIYVPSKPRIDVRLAHGFEHCVDANGMPQDPPAEGLFTVTFDASGQVTEINDSEACEVCADRGLRCGHDF